jgi:hypothetical protein
MTKHRTLLNLEELGGRVLPSTTTLPIPSHTGALTSTPQPAVSPLSGQGTGTYTNPAVPGALTVDGLTTYNFKGTANLAGMGQVHVTGTIHSVGFVITGQATGFLTFSNSRGSVTIALTGPLQAGFSALPTTFSYHVVAHTGAFAHLSAQGTLGLLVVPQTFNYVAQPLGNFALSIA